jgi:heme/copper-type cytochrome/quinol oxidase subunit 4
MNILIVLAIFVITLLLVMFVRTKNKSGYAKNSNPFIFRLAVAIWATAAIMDIAYNTSSPPVMEAKTQRVIYERRVNVSFILSGLLVLAAVYVMGKQEWARLTVDAIGAWKGKDIDNSTETLIEHALKNKSDREFVLEVLRIKHGKEQAKPSNLDKLEVVKE